MERPVTRCVWVLLIISVSAVLVPSTIWDWKKHLRSTFCVVNAITQVCTNRRIWVSFYFISVSFIFMIVKFNAQKLQHCIKGEHLNARWCKKNMFRVSCRFHWFETYFDCSIWIAPVSSEAGLFRIVNRNNMPNHCDCLLIGASKIVSMFQKIAIILFWLQSNIMQRHPSRNWTSHVS